MQKQVQASHRPTKLLLLDAQDNQPILCDGCDLMIEQEIYVEHWEKCIRIKNVNQKKQRERIKRQQQEKRIREEEEKRKEEEQKKNLVIVVCHLCGMKLPPGPNSLQNHKNECRQAQQKCQFCTLSIPGYLMQQHNQLCQVQQANRQFQNLDRNGRYVENQRSEVRNIRSEVNNQRENPPQRQFRQFAPNVNMPRVPNIPNQNIDYIGILVQQGQIRPQNVQQVRQLYQNGVIWFQQLSNEQFVLRVAPELAATLSQAGLNIYGNGFNPNGGGFNLNGGGFNPNGNGGFNPNGERFNPNGGGFNPNGNGGGFNRGQIQGNRQSRDSDLLAEFYQSFIKKQKFSQQQITNLKKTIQKDKTDEICTICISNIQKGQQILKTECDHIFHFNCITDWLKTAVKCPICNLKLKNKKQS